MPDPYYMFWAALGVIGALGLLSFGLIVKVDRLTADLKARDDLIDELQSYR